ncbi:MAG: outer membrane lipoprotein chaperone LolA [Steroidobacteraceae bacterium]
MKTGLKLAAALAVWLLAVPAAFAADNALDRYLDGLKTLRSQFEQRVVDAQGKDVEQGSGTLLVQRPGRFRWEYTPQGGGTQLLIADARNLWFYDKDLDQVTVKPVASALSATPVTLLSGTPEELKSAFDVSAQPAAEGLNWVRVVPHQAQADFSSAELGFAGNELKRMRIQDRLGQVVTLSFSRSERNARLSATDLQFVPPKGADVIGTPVAGGG